MKILAMWIFFFMRKKHPLSWDSPKGETSYIVTAYKIGHPVEKIQLKKKKTIGSIEEF